jgi:hypothetical protein
MGPIMSNDNSPDVWTPRYETWRHGGWYVMNVRYASGAVGCVSRNYADRKWRIVCDERTNAHELHTYPSRDAAARAERELAEQSYSLPPHGKNYRPIPVSDEFRCERVGHNYGGIGVCGKCGVSEKTDAQWLAELFEFELCGECERDADQHNVGPDALGLRHAYCTDPIPAGLTDADAEAELARRLARRVEVTEPATAYAAIRLTGTVSGYGPVRMRWTERTLSPSRILATWWQETGELASVAVYGNSTDQGLASKVVYWTETLDDAPPWVRDFVTEHQPPVIHTWANGYGLWFARVPATDNAASVAKEAIMGELAQRESNVCESRVGVELVSGNRDTVVYREVDPDDTGRHCGCCVDNECECAGVNLEYDVVDTAWVCMCCINNECECEGKRIIHS